MKPDGRKPEEQPAVRTTIVGGRPPGSGRKIGAVPRGIEVLTKKASVDPAFRKVLLARRSKAADVIGLALEPAEAMMLDGVPASQLEAIIAATKVKPSLRAIFMGKAAVVMLAAIGALGCSDDEQMQTKGISPDRPTAAETAAPASQENVADGKTPEAQTGEPIEPAEAVEVVPVEQVDPAEQVEQVESVEVVPVEPVEPHYQVEVAGFMSDKPVQIAGIMPDKPKPEAPEPVEPPEQLQKPDDDATNQSHQAVFGIRPIRGTRPEPKKD